MPKAGRGGAGGGAGGTGIPGVSRGVLYGETKYDLTATEQRIYTDEFTNLNDQALMEAMDDIRVSARFNNAEVVNFADMYVEDTTILGRFDDILAGRRSRTGTLAEARAERASRATLQQSRLETLNDRLRTRDRMVHRWNMAAAEATRRGLSTGRPLNLSKQTENILRDRGWSRTRRVGGREPIIPEGLK